LQGGKVPILHEFDYFKPQTLKVALHLLSKLKNTAILSGGTDLIGEMKEGVACPKSVIDIKGLEALRKLELKDGDLHIGALCTFTDLLKSKAVKAKFPLLWEASKTVGSMGIRNRATLVGNICSAVPCMDSGPPLSVYEAQVLVKSLAGNRKIPISKWFCGPRKTSLKQGEIVTGVFVPLPAKKHGGCYVKLGRYNGEDLAQASVAIMALPERNFRISFGSVGPIPLRATPIEQLLNGNKLNDSLIEKAKVLIPEIISPITDIRATKEYRLHICQVMFERGLKEAVNRLNGDNAKFGQNLI
jgi:CO/xanthine dehydrogenase FAD-binding subunit